MEQELEVKYTSKAAENIAEIALYISGKGYPETAYKFMEQLYLFGNSLGFWAYKYQICRHPQFAQRNYRCAVFRKNYVFIYEVSSNFVTVLNVVNCSTIYW